MQTEFANQPGGILHNHAILLDETIYADYHDADGTRRRKSIVLAVTGPSNSPFVTWSRWISVMPKKLEDQNYTVIEDTTWGHYFDKLEDAMLDYSGRVSAHKKEQEERDFVKSVAKDDGKAAAEWLIDGNTKMPAAVLKRLIDGIENGDPEILDDLPDADFSGQWAGDPIWEDWINDSFDRRYRGDDFDEELYNLYCEQYHEGVVEKIHEMYKELTKDA